MTRIMGVDPGFDRVGIAIIEKNTNGKEKLLYSECFITSKKESFEKRLLSIGNQIKKIIKEYGPEMLGIETLFLQSNQKTVMRVAEARGVILYECSKENLEIKEFSPPEIKKAITGDGRADKSGIIKMIQMILKIDKKAFDDEYDAMAVSLCASATQLRLK